MLKVAKLLLSLALLPACLFAASPITITPDATSQTIQILGGCGWTSGDTVLAYYSRSGSAGSSINTTALGSASSGWTSGGFYQTMTAPGTGMPCGYRLDIPNAWVAAGAKTVLIQLYDASNGANLGGVEVALDSSATLNGEIVLAPPLITDNGDGTVTIAVVETTPAGVAVDAPSGTAPAIALNDPNATPCTMSHTSTGHYSCTMNKPSQGARSGGQIKQPTPPGMPAARPAPLPPLNP